MWLGRGRDAGVVELDPSLGIPRQAIGLLVESRCEPVGDVCVIEARRGTAGVAPADRACPARGSQSLSGCALVRFCYRSPAIAELSDEPVDALVVVDDADIRPVPSELRVRHSLDFAQ